MSCILLACAFSIHIRTLHSLQTSIDPFCVHTLPPEIVASSSDLPIRIPDFFDLSDQAITCLYHRYVTSIQVQCIEPRSLGLADKRGGVLCVDNDRIRNGNCTAIIFDDTIHESYTNQLKKQFDCEIYLPFDSNGFDLYSSVGNWTSHQKDISSEISSLILKVESTKTDMYIVNELLLNTKVMSRVSQISLTVHLDPNIAQTVDYKEKLLILRRLYDLGFRIFFFRRTLNCNAHHSPFDQFLTCYAVYLKRPMHNLHRKIQIPDETVLRSMSTLEIFNLYDRYFSSLQITCQQIIRIGGFAETGWNVCHDAEYRPRQPCIIYSIGIDGDFAFDEQASLVYGCNVFSFDPTTGMEDHRHSEKVWSYNLGIGDQDHVNERYWKIRTLTSVMNMLNHSESNIDIFSMDIEGKEWPVLKQMLDMGMFERVGQLCIEIHAAFTKERLLIMRELYNHNFRIFWSNQNPDALKLNINRSEAVFTSDEFEVYFINTKLYGTVKH